MANNIIIYPTGTTGNLDPHTVFDDGTNKLQINVIDSGGLSTLSLSSSTVASGFNISPSGVVVSGASVTTSPNGVYVG